MAGFNELTVSNAESYGRDAWGCFVKMPTGPVRQNAMELLLTAGDFGLDEESRNHGRTPDERRDEISDVATAAQLGQRLIDARRNAASAPCGSQTVEAVADALMAAARAGHGMGEEEPPTSDLTEGADSDMEFFFSIHTKAALQLCKPFDRDMTKLWLQETWLKCGIGNSRKMRYSFFRLLKRELPHGFICQSERSKGL